MTSFLQIVGTARASSMQAIDSSANRNGNTLVHFSINTAVWK